MLPSWRWKRASRVGFEAGASSGASSRTRSRRKIGLGGALDRASAGGRVGGGSRRCGAPCGSLLRKGASREARAVRRCRSRIVCDDVTRLGELPDRRAVRVADRCRECEPVMTGPGSCCARAPRATWSCRCPWVRRWRPFRRGRRSGVRGRPTTSRGRGRGGPRRGGWRRGCRRAGRGWRRVHEMSTSTGCGPIFRSRRSVSPPGRTTSSMAHARVMSLPENE